MAMAAELEARARRRRGLLLALLTLLVTLPALSAGFFNDDLIHRLVLEDAIPGYRRGPHELYDFLGTDDLPASMMRDRGFLPWVAADDLRLRFFRPLSSLLHAAHHRLFGRAPLPAHLHSLLWFALLGTCVALLYRRVLDRRSSRVALAIYLLAGVHASPLGWLAARHALVAAALTAAALLAHVSARQDGRPARVALAAALALAGLAASETTLAIVPLVVLYELIVRTEDLRRRLAMAAPITLIGLAYLGFYGLGHYGAAGSGAYLSPFDEPFAFGAALFTRVPPLLAELYGGVPVMIWSMATAARVTLWVIGLLALGAALWLLWAHRASMASSERRRLAWLALASVACLAPMVGTVLDGRLLAVAAIGSAPVLAAALVHGWRVSREAHGARRWLPRSAVILLGLGAFALSPFVRAKAPSSRRSTGRRPSRPANGCT